MSDATPRRRRPDPEVADLVSSMLTASRALVAVSARSLAAVEDTVTLSQFRTLVVLRGRGETNLSGLAEALGVNASTAMRTIDRLLTAGLVVRQDDPSNRRQVTLRLTDRGRRLVDTVTARRRTEIERIVARMPRTHRAEIVAALSAFAAAADEPAAADDVDW